MVIRLPTPSDPDTGRQRHICRQFFKTDDNGVGRNIVNKKWMDILSSSYKTTDDRIVGRNNLNNKPMAVLSRTTTLTDAAWSAFDSAD